MSQSIPRSQRQVLAQKEAGQTILFDAILLCDQLCHRQGDVADQPCVERCALKHSALFEIMNKHMRLTNIN